MKIILFSILIFLTLPAWANDLEIRSLGYSCKKQDESSRHTYQYYFRFYIKNISDRELNVVSEINSIEVVKRNNEDYEVVLGNGRAREIKGTPIIPSAVSFKLVPLKPGEAASLSHKFDSTLLLPKITLTYGISDFYNGRFGFWSGEASSPNVTLDRECL